MATNYAEAYSKFQKSIKEAVNFADPNWTNSAITRERIKRVKAARTELLKAVPEATGQPEQAVEARAAVFAQLRPTDANTVAVTASEWAKVEKLLAAGRDLGQLIRTADRSRLAAILDQFPTSDVAVKTGDPEGVIREVEDLAFDRLVTLGDVQAKGVADASKVANHEGAWHQVIQEAARGNVSVGAQSALHKVAPEEFQATLGHPEEEANVAAKLKSLDHTAQFIREGSDAAE